ncbi:hypothetical protein [Pseudomonas sp. NPDC089569]|uniref:hypothetical protein n=1 Tax=Pseudomonas sp. NPDC089569 TaxID=3390722 RepID=UPI003D00DD74
MSTDTERSFIASMTTNYGNLHLPRITYNRKTLVNRWYYELSAFDRHVDVSSYLCVAEGAPTDQLEFYFKCIDDYYSIYLLTDSHYDKYALSNENKSFISAFRYDDDQTTYNLLDSKGEIVTIDQLEGETHTLKIQTRGGRKLSVQGKTDVGGIVCTGKEGGSVLTFKLEVLERGIS